ncbi:hypothetical protein [Hufsiella ginkgonis]|uniref:Uncharacterized protein n=1 Tax=Hufsiella ginkgonis TaxID=2695274 RepID=A0A7K1Y284_9SPHI|nr:hypothetical protein [Hufsiella ginkgonis]MXV17167.1 hypothetical protein [Hufsiella ginkgonis]
MMKHLTLIILILVFLASAGTAIAQNLKGLWIGGLVSDTTGVPVLNTNYVLHVKQQMGSIVSGRAYVLERRFQFEGILDFIGMIKDDRLDVVELKINSSKTPVATKFLCIKNMDLKITLGKGKDILQGHWTGKMEDRSPCTAGGAYLSRYNTENEGLVPPATMRTILADTGPIRFLNTNLSEPVVINVSSRTVHLMLNDYQKEDNDTVSVYQNRRPFIKKLAIFTIPYLKTLKFDVNSDMQELVLVAENLGRVPPNTSTLTIDDGVTTQKVSIVATKQISAVIYLKYTGK